MYLFEALGSMMSVLQDKWASYF